MPIIQIYSPLQSPPPLLLHKMCEQVCTDLSLPPDKAWAIWNYISPENHYRPGWAGQSQSEGPIVVIFCKQQHAPEKVSKIMQSIRQMIAFATGCNKQTVFIAVHRVSELLETVSNFPQSNHLEH